MPQINALSLTQFVKDWLMNSRHPRVLHVFDQVCNLINEQKDVLSIVTPQIGNGPFNLVVKENVSFSDFIDEKSNISIQTNQLHLGDLIITTDDAPRWNPQLEWNLLHSKRNDLLDQLERISVSDHQVSIPDSLLTDFSRAIVNADFSTIVAKTSKLAGLGQGLTPSGDDFLMGTMYATWIIHPSEVASKLGNEIAETAAPLTTSLSGAWIKSAAKGEAGQVWHEFLDALIEGDETAIQLRMDNILAVGETSGADALAGFLSTMQAYIASFSRNAATSSTE